ncbi:MAG: aminoacyl-tRNA hydrolase [Bacteroidales bacterium]|nr:aminoacyl-tRNA hydrolase [Bacteroidales bacterium]
MKYLIVGLGNIGDEYKNTRHNIGFMVLDAMAMASNTSFIDKRYGEVCSLKHKGREFILLKPSTYMNLSGNAVRYWLAKEKIPVENLLVIVDDIALPIGSFRMRPKGSDGGHNGLANIIDVLGTNQYARIRVGIGDNFFKGGQIHYVLGDLTPDEKKVLDEKIPIIIEMIKSFGTIGTELTMTAFNKFGKPSSPNNNTPNDNPIPKQ